MNVLLVPAHPGFPGQIPQSRKTVVVVVVLLLLLLQSLYRSFGFVRDYPCDLVPERQNQEGKTNLDLLEQEIVNGSGIC